ncbi:MFS transporter [Streptacidiphilus albus]|uniref:MFS transporter n=1 Tax=Streptacidiphilus albus TaxID=105425 RepID=UPI00068DE9E3|nr:MFS transporter [Streptacidiphilus albus]
MGGSVPGEVALASAKGRWVLATTVLGSAMAMLDGSAVNIALPRIGEDLHAPLSALQWAVDAYLLTLAGLILLGGALGDRYGRRRVFLTGVVWFALASAACGLAPDVEVLVAARALQGVGGALLAPGSLALIQAIFREQDRPAAVGLWSGLGGVAGALGPLAGGWLVGGPGWRWVFLINLPLAAVVLAIALRQVPENRDESASGRFDLGGAGLAALALGSLTAALTAAPTAPTLAAWAGAAAVAAGAAFVLTERRSARPMLPLDLFASRLFTVVNVATVLIYAALGGVLFFLVLELQVAAGFPPLEAGLSTLPVTLLMLLFSPAAARLGQRIGPRLPLTLGPLLAGAGILLMLRIGADASYAADVLPAAVVLGAGMTLLVAPLTATALAAAEDRRAGIASGVNNAAARTGSLLAVAALPALVGLSGTEYQRAAVVDGAFRGAMAICAGLMFAAALLSWVAVRPKT